MYDDIMVASITVDIAGRIEERSFKTTHRGMAALFIEYICSASQDNNPQKIRLAVTTPVYSQVDRAYLSLENSMVYWNPAYIQLHPEEEAYV